MRHIYDKYSIDTSFYVTRFCPGCLRSEVVPWSDEVFNCVILNMFGNDLDPKLAKSVAVEACRANTDYVETAGPEAEWFHDLVDTTSVEIGRQDRAGDGSPMTTWHTDVQTIADLADHMGRGLCRYYVAVLLCPDMEYDKNANELSVALTHQLNRCD